MSREARDKLFEDVRYGRLMPSDAEAEAKRLGLEPLAPQVDPADFNPMGEVWWTLPMAVAWISWRSSREVLELWDPYRTACWDWHFRKWRVGFDGPHHEGHFLEQREPATITLLYLREKYDQLHFTLPEGFISVGEAKAKLWKALSEDVLRASGVDRSSGERVKIAPEDWRDLETFQERKRTILMTRREHTVSGPTYSDVVFRRQNIMSIWNPARIEERGLSLPETVRPDGPGYMPLYCAAQWIATQGGKRDFEPHYVPIWERAYSELLARISSDQVAVTGKGKGRRERLEGHLFASIAVDYPFADASIELILSDDLHLQSYAFVDDEQWHKGFDDCLRNGRAIEWSQLMVLKSDIAKWWPFGMGTGPAETHSGAAGRPSAMHLVETEFQRRCDAGELPASIGQLAAELHEWFLKAHPTLRAAAVKTIANNLRGPHREARAKARN